MRRTLRLGWTSTQGASACSTLPMSVLPASALPVAPTATGNTSEHCSSCSRERDLGASSPATSSTDRSRVTGDAAGQGWEHEPAESGFRVDSNSATSSASSRTSTEHTRQAAGGRDRDPRPSTTTTGSDPSSPSGGGTSSSREEVTASGAGAAAGAGTAAGRAFSSSGRDPSPPSIRRTEGRGTTGSTDAGLQK